MVKNDHLPPFVSFPETNAGKNFGNLLPRYLWSKQSKVLFQAETDLPPSPSVYYLRHENQGFLLKGHFIKHCPYLPITIEVLTV